MKYHGHVLIKFLDSDVEGGSYYKIFNSVGKYITSAWTLSNAKEFVDSYDGKDYSWSVLG